MTRSTYFLYTIVCSSTLVTILAGKDIVLITRNNAFWTESGYQPTLQTWFFFKGASLFPDVYEKMTALSYLICHTVVGSLGTQFAPRARLQMTRDRDSASPEKKKQKTIYPLQPVENASSTIWTGSLPIKGESA